MENVQFLFIIAKMNSKNLKAQKINIFYGFIKDLCSPYTT